VASQGLPMAVTAAYGRGHDLTMVACAAAATRPSRRDCAFDEATGMSSQPVRAGPYTMWQLGRCDAGLLNQ